MNLKNANIGVVAGVAVFIVGSLLTKGDPNKLETMLIASLMLGAVVGVITYLDERDERLGRTPPRSLFRR